MWLLSWVSFFADVSSEMVYPLLPLFLVGVLGASRTQLGAVEGTAVLLVAVMTTVAGIRSDRVGGSRVPWIRWGYGLPVAGKAVIAMAVAWPWVLGGRLLDRFGKGLRGAPRDALIVDAVAADQRGQAFGLHRAFDTAGAFIGVLVSALLLWWLTGTPQSDATGVVAPTPAWIFRVIFAVGAGLGLVALAVTFLVREPEQGPATRSTTAIDGAAEAAGLPRSYWSLLAVLGLFSLANSSDVFLLLRASELGFSAWSVVDLYAVYNLTYALFAYPAGLVSDRFGRWRVMAAGWAVYAAVYAGFALLPAAHAWGVWPLMAAYGVYMALTDGVGKALIGDLAPKARRGTAMGIHTSVTGVAGLAASVAMGWLWDAAGPGPAFATGAGFAALALVVLAVRRP